MRNLFVIPFCLWLVSCNAGSGKVDLRWKIKPGESIKYSATLAEIKLDPNFKLDGLEVLKSPILKDKLHEALKAYKDPVGTLEIELVGEQDGFKVKSLAIQPKYDSPAEDELEERKRKMAELRVGMVDILAWVDFKGRLKSFYLKQKQKNTVALFFKLPELDVKVGDDWTLPVTLIDIGQGFVPKEAVRDQQAKLVSLTKNAKGDMIAEILYINAEKVNGQFEYSDNDIVVPLSLEYSSFMRGQFNVTKGRWEKFIGISYVSGSGLSQNESMLAFMLKPLD